MSYDPFVRGPFPVGVRSVTAVRGERPLPVEIWVPAADEARGRDVDPATRDTYELLPGFPPVWQEAVRDAAARRGRFPLVLFSHGFGGHRRQTTFLCTHLASHGYVVAAVDHTGNSILDMVQMVMQIQMGGSPPDPDALLTEFVEARPADVVFVLDGLLDGSIGDVASLVDETRIGMSGHSFGGWTTLAVTRRDPRIRAALPLAPAGGKSPLPGEKLRDALDFEWGRDVPTLFLVADRDTLLPLEGMHELLGRTKGTKKMVVLHRADHMHFCDRVEEVHEMFRTMPPPGDFERIAKHVPPIGDLCPGEHAYLFIRGLGLAHFDAVLRESEAAAGFLGGDVEGALRERGVEVSVVGS